MSKAVQDWSRDELERIAACLEHDLRSAGPRFSIEFTPLSPHTRMIASAPPVDMPPEFAVPGGGGFIEGADWDDPERLPEPVKRMHGYMHAALGEPAPVAISLRVDGTENMSLTFWSRQDHIEQLEGLLDQVQDVVMETRAELWPLCPVHDHPDPLRPQAGRDWVQWCCPGTGKAVAPFGALPRPD